MPPVRQKLFSLGLATLMVAWFPLLCCCTAEAGTPERHGHAIADHGDAAPHTSHTDEGCDGTCESHADSSGSSDHCTCELQLQARDQAQVDQPVVPLVPPVLFALIFQLSYESVASDPLLARTPQRADFAEPCGPGGDSLRAQCCLLTI